MMCSQLNNEWQLLITELQSVTHFSHLSFLAANNNNNNFTAWLVAFVQFSILHYSLIKQS